MLDMVEKYYLLLWKFTSGDGVSLKTPRPRGWVRAGRPSGGESSFNKRNMYQYPHVSQLFILTSVAKPGIPGAIKNGWVCTADYRMLLGTAVRPVPARMPYISRLCDVGATDVKRWWWWWYEKNIISGHLWKCMKNKHERTCWVKVPWNQKYYSKFVHRKIFMQQMLHVPSDMHVPGSCKKVSKFSLINCLHAEVDGERILQNNIPSNIWTLASAESRMASMKYRRKEFGEKNSDFGTDQFVGKHPTEELGSLFAHCRIGRVTEEIKQIDYSSWKEKSMEIEILKCRDYTLCQKKGLENADAIKIVDVIQNVNVINRCGNCGCIKIVNVMKKINVISCRLLKFVALNYCR